MGKTKVIAETGAGQHGVATATGAALFGMECTVYMGAEDIERQALNVFKMELLGAKVQPVTTGSSTLKDATNEAIRTWAEKAEDTFYVIGSAVGPHPYPKMVKEFQRIISTEARRQILKKEGRLPDAVVACVGGGSNSIGMFADFIDDKDVDHRWRIDPFCTIILPSSQPVPFPYHPVLWQGQSPCAYQP